MAWTVKTLNATIDDELDALPAGIKARLSRIVELIKELGLDKVGEPHVKHLEGKLGKCVPRHRKASPAPSM